MSGPPKDIPASELWTKLQETPRPSKIIDFPRNGKDGKPMGQLRLRLLTQMEHMACTTEAERFARHHLKDGKRDDIGYEALYADEACVQILHRVCRDVEDLNKSLFPTPKHLRENLTADECAVLFDQYMTLRLELGPVASASSPEELEAWIERIGEGGSAFPFSLLSSDMQKVLIVTMACRLRSYAKDTSSAGSPPEELSTSPSSLDELQPSDEDAVDEET